MKNNKLIFFLILSIFGLPACANYKLNYSKEGKQWEKRQVTPTSPLAYRMYLLGDAGNAPMNGTTNVLKYLKTKLAAESSQSSIFFLGNNIYPGGMPPKGETQDRKLAEYRLKIQMDILENFAGSPYFLPGNHDWRQWGLKGLKREENFIEGYLNRKIENEDNWQNYFLPDNGCPGPEVLEINDNLVVLIIDSQWWMADWDREPTIHEGCEVKNRMQLQFFVENAMRKHRRKNVVVAMHHPLFSNGPHGGSVTAKEHLFPLTQFDKNLYIPLPGIGTIGAFLRGTIGSKQDVAHQTYKDLKRRLLVSAKKNGNFIFVAGHEHNLQYMETEQQTFIVSGAGSKESPSRIGNGAQFAYGKRGYTTLDFHEDGSAYTNFWIPNEAGTNAKLVFRKKLKEKKVPNEEAIPKHFPIFEMGLDSIEMAVSQTEAGKIGFLHKTMLGEHHRTVYQHDYKFPVLDLNTFKGGMVPVKRGGGNQTNGLRLKTKKDGKQYVMRAMTKDASRTLPFPFNKMTAAKFIAEDNFLSTHPFAPTAIPYLAEAANIYHTNPTLYFVPKQPALGVFNDEYGGDVYLVEERPAGSWEGTGNFGDSKKIVGTPDVVAKIVKNHKHYIDGKWALRSRLFDMIIGDWDRHDDQWRWARFDKNDPKDGDEHYLYRPIPRDRDQAFSKYDGAFIEFARLFMPFLRQLRIYNPEIQNMKWMHWSSRTFDRTFLNELDWQDWQQQVNYLQKNMTDEAIENAFKHWPAKVQELTADHIIHSIKTRRDNLDKIALKFYQRLSKKADVFGTDKKEIFEVDRMADGQVKVRVWESNKQGEKEHLFFERTFTSDVTEEIHIYGVGDKDIFKVKGEVNKSILVRLIGGQGKDVFIDESYVKKGSPKTLVYDDLKKNTVELGREAKDKRGEHREMNIYDRKASHYETDFFVPLPVIAANPDDGFTLGMNAHLTKYAFKKSPYAALHSFGLTYAFATKSIAFNYEGDYLDVFGHGDFFLEARLHNSAYAANFYGLGNETRINNEIDYYRTRQSQIHLFPAYKKRLAGGAGNFKIGPLFELRDLEATEDRFLITEFEESAAAELYQRKTFAGAKMNFEFINLDNYVTPHRGIHLDTDLEFLGGLENDGTNFGTIRTSFAFYQSLDQKENWVFASKLGLDHNIGDDFEFYHAPHIGSNEGLRGYRSQRFYGKTVFYQNIDIRARLFSSYNETLPFTFGLYAGFDHGRVWLETEDSNQWHYNYGGGFWIAPVDVLTFSFGVFQPKEAFEEGPRFSFKLGLGF